jgi:hypothetical protein
MPFGPILNNIEKHISLEADESGALRAFHLSPDAKDSTIMFAIADWWITDMYCFVMEQPAMQNIIAIREQLRVLQNLSLSAEERYDIFLGKYPQLIPYLSQKQIAS